tara:strand:- start:113 stop:577 length:465 start_codon:yes stop_codon:yes gene_type:complete
MKDQDLELLLESIKGIEKTLDTVEKKVLNIGEQLERHQIMHNSFSEELHEIRIKVDSKYKEKWYEDNVHKTPHYYEETGTSFPPNKMKYNIEEGFKLSKEIDHTEYLRCLDEGEDTTWYIDKWIKGTPGLDDQDEVAQSEEDEETKYLHYRDNE